MNLLENYPLHELSVGRTASYRKTLTQDDVILFAACSGDLNPLHLDKDYAATTPFGEPIGHGMWTGALVKIGDTVTITLTITEIKERLRLVILDCEAHNQEGKLVAKGVAEVIAPAEKQFLPAGKLPLITLG